jgi:hypothetical protein
MRVLRRTEDGQLSHAPAPWAETGSALRVDNGFSLVGRAAL